jgi:hypothetical protein
VPGGGTDNAKDRTKDTTRTSDKITLMNEGRLPSKAVSDFAIAKLLTQVSGTINSKSYTHIQVYKFYSGRYDVAFGNVNSRGSFFEVEGFIGKTLSQLYALGTGSLPVRFTSINPIRSA